MWEMHVCHQSLDTLRAITRLVFTCYSCYKFCAFETVSVFRDTRGDCLWKITRTEKQTIFQTSETMFLRCYMCNVIIKEPDMHPL